MTAITRLAVLQALRAGKAAATAGEPVTACPHPVDSADAGDRILARYWIRGYAGVRPAVTDPQ